MTDGRAITAPNALGETGALRERWLRQAFEKAIAESSAGVYEIEHADETSANALINLDQDAAMALLKEINADLAASRIRQKMAVKSHVISHYYSFLLFLVLWHRNSTR